MLHASAQCLALVQFDGPAVLEQSNMVDRYKQVLQAQVNKFFNATWTPPSQVTPTPPSVATGSSSRPSHHSTTGNHRTANHHRRQGTSTAHTPRATTTSLPNTTALSYTAPDSLADGVCRASYARTVGCDEVESWDRCRICSGTMQARSTFKLYACGHMFHRDCLMKAMEQSCRCPQCDCKVREPVGRMPSGSMTISVDPSMSCRGYETVGTIVITYEFPRGTQKQYHVNPGVEYQGTCRKAYLPDCEDGRNLLKRLGYAFARGLTFTIGTSLTTGMSNAITWACIPHKTTVDGGMYGFPDAGYFKYAHEELDKIT